ncbi:MAG: phosphoribosylglycinamide formyltransferase [Acidobacteriota bacterium]
MSDDRLPRVAVLISGRGSNLQALIDAVARGSLKARLALVVSNKANAAGLARAREAGVETIVISPHDYPERAAFDRALVEALQLHRIELVCLAGFMRLLGREFCEAFPNRVLNIHPSLLPAFPGVDAQRLALEHGVKVSGATVHFVTPELDAGPIVQQVAVTVREDDTVSSLAARILDVEHVIYPAAVQRILHEPWRIEGRRVSFAAPRTS